MKILFVAHHTTLSGGVRAIFEIANRLDARNYDVRIIAFSGTYDWYDLKVPIQYVDINKSKSFGPLQLFTLKFERPLRWLWENVGRKLTEDLNFQSVLDTQLERISGGRFGPLIGWNSNSLLELAKLIGDCDICVATWFPTALPVWIKKTGKLYYFLQDSPEIITDKRSLSLFEKTLKLPFYFLTNSRDTAELVLEHQMENGAKLKVIGVGVDEQTFYQRAPITLDSKRKIIMAIMRDEVCKGADIAIKALNEINERIPIYGILVGSKHPLKKIKPKFPYVFFENISDDDYLARLYSSANVFIFTSFVETFGLPPIEAMACGTAVVTTDCKGNRDYAVNGHNCLMVPPGDYVAIANAAIEVLTNNELLDKLRAEGLKTAKTWTWERVVDKFEDALLDNMN